MMYFANYFMGFIGGRLIYEMRNLGKDYEVAASLRVSTRFTLVKHSLPPS